jgi:hypothetical protein
MNAILYGNTGISVSFNNVDMSVDFNVYDRKVINSFQFIADLFNIYNVVTTNVSTIKSRQVAFAPFPLNTYATNKQYIEDLSWVVSPLGPDAGGKYVTGVKTYDQFYFIPSTTKEPEKIFKLMCEWSLLFNSSSNPEMVGTPEEINVNRVIGWGVPRDPRDIAHTAAVTKAHLAGESILIADAVGTFGLSATLNNILLNDIIKLRNPVSTALATAYPLGKSIIDTAMK